MKAGDAFPHAVNAKPIGEHPGMQASNSKDIPSVLTKDWIISNPKYQHLSAGIGHFKCNPIKIEMKPDAEPDRKATRRVPLALKDKFTGK